MADEATRCAIVLLGAMNPRIHHPSWYRTAELLDANAEKLALQNPDTVCSQHIAHFRTAELQVSCLPDRWHVATDQVDLLDRLTEILIHTFDGKLHETPITAFGFNFEFHRRTDISDVASYLADCFRKLPIGVCELPSVAATFSSFHELEDNKVKLDIQPSVRSVDMLYIALNFHYEITSVYGPVQQYGHFPLEPLIQPRIRADYDKASVTVTSILKALNQSKEVKNHGS